MGSLSTSLRRHWVLLLVVMIGVVIVVLGAWSRMSQANQLKQTAQRANVPTVSLVGFSEVPAQRLILAGRVEAWASAPIYARTAGYLKSWSTDIGQSVEAGQVLAEIETPDLDQELLQAKAELETARSGVSLAAATAKRWQALLSSDSVSRQEADEKARDYAASKSRFDAAKANVERVYALQRYKTLVAPFAGVVTARNTDVGSLINVGMMPGSELFVVSDISKLRVFVDVPQRQVALVKQGDRAILEVPDRPGQQFTAVVGSSAKAFNASSGAMRVQLIVDNASGDLFPGSYGTVTFAPASSLAGLGIPPSALIFNGKGTQIATVDADLKVALRPVKIARDHGTVIELEGAVDNTARLINSPPDGLQDGQMVEIAKGAEERFP